MTGKWVEKSDTEGHKSVEGVLAEAHRQRGKSSHLSHTVNAWPVTASHDVQDGADIEPAAQQGESLSHRHGAFPFLRSVPATANAASTLKEGHCSAHETSLPLHLDMLAQKLLRSGRTVKQPVQPFRWTHLPLELFRDSLSHKGLNKAHGHVNRGVYLFIYLLAYLLLLLLSSHGERAKN